MHNITKILTTLLCLNLGFGAMPAKAAPVNSNQEGRGALSRQKADTRGAQKLIEDSGHKLQNNEIEGACRDIRAAFGTRDFATLDDRYLAASYAILAVCDSQDGAYEKAWADLIQLEKYLPKDAYPPEIIKMKISTARLSGHFREALEDIIYLAKKSPEDVLKYEMRYITSLNEAAESLDDNRALQQKFLETLRSINYKDPKGLASVAYYWFDLFEIYVAQGKTEAAQALVSEFDTPSLVVRLRIDKRYRGFVDADPARFDYQKVFEMDMERDRLIMESHPTLLEPIIIYSGDLIAQGKNEQALSLIEGAIQKAKASPAEKPAFEDQDEQLNWALSEKAALIWDLGRFEEANAIMVTSRDDAIKNGGDQVSQVINLAGSYCSLEQPQKALENLKLYDEKGASDFGKLAFRAVRLCAYTQLGDRVHAKEDLDYILAHPNDSFGNYKSALLTVNDQTGVAKSIISRLDDPKTRNDTLMLVQTYRQSQFETPYETTIRKRFEAVLARADVKAAIAKYGYVDTYIAH